MVGIDPGPFLFRWFRLNDVVGLFYGLGVMGGNCSMVLGFGLGSCGING